MVYDSHEYFTEAEGLTGRNFQKNIWLRIERFIFPKLEFVYTVNQSIANIYSKKYGVKVGVVRNIAKLGSIPSASKSSLELPENKKIIVLQGAYIDPDRGGKEAVLAMAHVENALLLVIGAGREMALIKELAQRPELKDKVKVFPKLPYQELQRYTVVADLGLSLDKPLHMNYTLSLPNKLFDYIHHGVPVLGSNLVELKGIITTYNVGWIVDEVTPEAISQKINEVLFDEKECEEKKLNCLSAREILNWQNEEKQIIETFNRASAS
ncbi:MAG: glycosyltransferase [Flavobacteriales bacterium]